MNVRRKREGRQLGLMEQNEATPRWETLPEQVRRDVITLLAKLLRNDAGEEEVADE